MQIHPSDKITIIDFGSQYTQLIARRIREQEVYSEIISPQNAAYEELCKNPPKGLILSGGPRSVTEEAIAFDPRILELDIPILGVCYGMQLLNHLHKGLCESQESGEYGKQGLQIEGNSPLFSSLSSSQNVWMSHKDSITELASPFHIIGKSADGKIAAIEHQSRPVFGLQFHPEVQHTPQGTKIIKNFLDLCSCEAKWNMESYIEKIKSDIREKVGNKKVVSFVSGGVDSTVATCLCIQAIGPENVHALYIDTGLMRAGESEEVAEMFHAYGLKNLVMVDAKDRYIDALKNVSEPEKKREIIGDLFLHLLEEQVEELGLKDSDSFLCQGTLYTDLIESGLGCGQNAAVIKSHHNVNPPIIAEKRRQGRLIEPNSTIFKDEVRDVAKLLNLPEKMIARHPFPGPGLGIRILGSINKDKLDILREADRIYLEEIRSHGLYEEIWQAFSVLLPVRSVGVMGDQRTEGFVVALRAVTSQDGMTAESYDFPHEVLKKIMTRIINSVPGVNRVVYDITSKPPGTIEWE